MNEKGVINFELNRRYCKSCSICVDMCPKHVLEMDADKKPVLKDPDNCIMCQMCELRCPDFAIRISRKEV